jgi:hypothetical protein
MFAQLSTPLPCETMQSKSTSCNRPATLALFNAVETLGYVGYTMQPICTHCITLLATAAGQANPSTSEAIEATTIKQVLATRLGLEGADEVLSALRAAVSGAEGDDDGDD